ncbi:MAG: NAD(P)H-dependent oxidoreductase [Bacteroidia bacterium]
MKVGIISGSARKGNNTIRVAYALSKLIDSCEIVDFQNYDLPGFAEEPMNVGSESPFQKKLIQVMNESQLVFILSPEYNWFPSAEIINMVHVFGSDDYKDMFDNKVIATIGVSSGRGGRMPAVQLSYVFNKIISFMELNSVVSPKSFEAQEVTKCIGEGGELLEVLPFNKGFESFVDYSVKLAKRWQASS